MDASQFPRTSVVDAWLTTSTAAPEGEEEGAISAREDASGPEGGAPLHEQVASSARGARSRKTGRKLMKRAAHLSASRAAVRFAFGAQRALQWKCAPPVDTFHRDADRRGDRRFGQRAGF